MAGLDWKKFARRADTGVTLIELLVALSVFTLLTLIIFAFQRNIFRVNGILSQHLDTQRETRSVFSKISAEVRSLSPSSTGAYPIMEASDDQFVFHSDIDNDGSKERLRYFLENGTLKRGVLKPSGDPLAYDPADEAVADVVSNVANGAEPVFEYYDTDYNGATAPLPANANVQDIRLVKITVLVDADPNQLPEPVAVTTQVSMRNLKDNL